MKICSVPGKLSMVAATMALLCAAIVQDCLAPQHAEARSRRTRSRKVNPARITWAALYTAGQKQAKASGRLMMVDVYTDWCGACHYLDDTTYKDRKIIQLSRRFVPVKINAEKGGEAFAKRYKIEGYPTILFLDGSGKEIKRLLGAYPAQDFGKVMTELLASQRTRS